MHDIVSRLLVVTGTMNLPNGVMSHELLELMNQITFYAHDSYFLLHFWVHLMVSKTIEFICGTDKVQHKFDKYSHDNHVKYHITKNTLIESSIMSLFVGSYPKVKYEQII
jgi:hypothetical protein